ncbi:toll-like receptor 4 [Mizuhopecten yessoensis]|nr:toll-like receptor 4 [Mizuhopecten yessoensis]
MPNDMIQRFGMLSLLLVLYTSCVHCGTFKNADTCLQKLCRCFPSSKLVNCTGRDMQYIPVLPTYTKTVLFTKTNFSNITGKFLFNLTLIPVERLHFIDTLTKLIDPDSFVNLTKISTLEISRNYELPQDLISPILAYTPKIRTVKLTSNRWTTVPEDMFSGLHNSSISVISLKNNWIVNISGRHFFGLHFLQILDLSNNSLSQINFTGFESTSISTINLASNHFTKVPSFCGPTAQLTGKYKTLKLQQNYIRDLDGSSFQCLQFLHNLFLDKNSVSVIRSNTFAQLPKLEKLSMTFIGDHLHTIEGYAFNSSSLKNLDIGNNRYKFDKLPWLYRTVFASLPNLLSLDLTGNSLPSESKALGELFTNLNKLEKLILENTALKALPRNVFQNIPNLESLILIGNYISGWGDDPEVFGNVTSLRSLYLDGNNIKPVNKTSFPEHFLNSLDKLCLTNNPYTCTCDLKWFVDWIKSTKHTIIVNYPRRYACRYPPEMNNVLLKNYNPTTKICSHIDYPLIRNICIAVFVPSTIILIVVSVGYKFRFRLSYWLHILGIKRVGYKRIESDTDYRYDAFVIYSTVNRDFVFNYMIPELEDKAGCRLCIHERDFEVGRFILDNITNHFEHSKNIILVLSTAILNSEWCTFELSLTQSRTAIEGPGVLTVILLEELDTAILPSTVRAILDTVTYTEWSQEKSKQSRIWAKIVTALNTHKDGVDLL